MFFKPLKFAIFEPQICRKIQDENSAIRQLSGEAESKKNKNLYFELTNLKLTDLELPSKIT